MPPCVERRISRHAFYALSLEIGGHFVTDQAGFAQDRRRDARVCGIEKRRDDKSRCVLSLLVKVVNDLWKPLLPKQLGDGLRLDKVEHEPVAVVVVARVMMIKL